MKILVFNGLPKGTHTFYELKVPDVKVQEPVAWDEDGNPTDFVTVIRENVGGRIVRAEPGHRVPVESVWPRRVEDLTSRKLATIIDEDEPSSDNQAQQ